MNRRGKERSHWLLIGAIAAVGALLVACGGGGSGAATAVGSGTASGTPALSGSITVYAAASLTTAFYKEGAAFQAAHPGTRVNFNFNGSPTLVTQLDEGAPADVLATADQKNMKNASDKSLVTKDVRTFARNRLVVALPKSNPGHVKTLADLARHGVKLVLAETGVPVGDYARQALKKMDSDPSYGASFSVSALKNVVSLESNVKAVVSKVQLGDTDAGIVYATDITPGVAKDITTIAIPDQFNVIASYPIAVTARAANPRLAAAFVQFVLSGAGQKILADEGFMGAH